MWRKARLLVVVAAWLALVAPTFATTTKYAQVFWSQLYNATTSDFSFGVATSQDLLAQTSLAYVYMDGPAENTNGWIWGKTDAAVHTTGPKLSVFNSGGSYQIAFTGSSSGSGFSPFKNSSVTGIITAPMHIAATWDGSLAAAGIDIYAGRDGAPLTLVGVASSGDGSGTASPGTGNVFHVGNCEGTDHTWNGTIWYVARWNRILSLNELRIAQKDGPLSIRAGLVLLWANRIDYSQTQLKATSETAIVASKMPNITSLGPFAPTTLWDVPAAAGGGGSPTVHRLPLLGAGD